MFVNLKSSFNLPKYAVYKKRSYSPLIYRLFIKLYTGIFMTTVLSLFGIFGKKHKRRSPPEQKGILKR